MPTILVTGASGLLGRPLVRELQQVPGWDVVGTAFARVRPGLAHLDLCDASAVAELLGRVRPDVIIHAAAERRPDVSANNPAATRRLNVDATARLRCAAAARRAWLVYVSTDYVFDGTCPPYAPEAATNPLNDYGRSKRDGELAVWEATSDAAVLRVPILYGEVERLDESAVTGVALPLLAAQGQCVRCEDWATRYPTLTDDVAVVLRQMIAHRLAHADFHGTFHWSGNEPMTKYAMARVIATALGLDPSGVVADPRPAGAARPKDSHLDCGALELLGIGRRTPFAAAITEVLRPFRK